ncbi:hypothetical protein ACJQWK_07092 [Exserohilum turcicum]|uniref:Uncharacterized protein n=1 Tax=Exserohilum turcicum (strain 28A) TaxID=671987 RepID=R0K7J0_EXST2|nr:uncharacterized protein SETTUDRAFT_91949 [Exserohilum turcica Et28A]EOA85494.1 hypothetical protein SETTUDRAFT_91949 [Exserohilum turcica Et28A]
MRFTIIASALLAPLAVLAAPMEAQAGSNMLVERQSTPPKPAPCVPNPKTTVEQTKQRAQAFAQAFIYHPNITEAFTYINSGYINHNPSVKNGFDNAWDVLAPIGNQQKITPLKTAFQSPQSWLNYKSDFGEVVDRYRWEDGCIAEHWDQGETFPTNIKNSGKST